MKVEPYTYRHTYTHSYIYVHRYTQLSSLAHKLSDHFSILIKIYKKKINNKAKVTDVYARDVIIRNCPQGSARGQRDTF